MGGSPDDYNWGSVGYFDTSKSADMEMCRLFRDKFRNIPYSNARLIMYREEMGFMKAFSFKESANIPYPASYVEGEPLNEFEFSKEQMKYLASNKDYIKARRALDVRLSDRIDFGNQTAGSTGTINVVVLRHFAKTFCDGCTPMGELGSFRCDLDYTVLRSDDGTIDIDVTNARNEAGSYHNLGLAYPKTAAGQAEFVFKVILILWLSHILLYSISGSIKSHEAQVYLASRSSATGEYDASSSTKAFATSRRSFLLEFLLPLHFRAGEACFSIGFIIYNSDFIVLFQALFTLGSLVQSLAIQREVLWWFNLDPTLRSFITRTAVNGRIMWIFLALFKAIKAMILRYGGPEKAKKIMFHNNLFVLLYIASLFLLDSMLDLFFANKIHVANNPIAATSDVLHVFDGFYVKRLPMVAVHSLLTVIAVSVMMQLLDHSLGKHVEDVSIYEIFAGSHLTVLWDPDMARVLPHRTGRSLLFMPIGTLMNLKWFMKTHLFTMSTNVRKRKYAVETAESLSGSSRHSGEGSKKLGEDEQKRRAAEETNVFCRITRDGNVDIKYVNDAATFFVVEQTPAFYKWLKSNSRVKVH